MAKTTNKVAPTKSEQANLIGGLLVEGLLKPIIDKAMDRVLKSPSIPIESKATAEAVAQVVVAEVSKEVEARDTFAKNAEPAYQSPVTIGSTLGVIGAATALYTILSDGVIATDEQTLFGTAATTLVGALFALWGRWFAKKPLGS